VSTTIDFRTTETQPFILLPAFINGIGPFQFVLDTGAGVPIITEELAKTVALQNVEVKEALGAGGKKIGVSIGLAGSIIVGGSKVENAKVGIMETLPKCVGEGVIGYDFLKHFVVTIDYMHNTLTLAAPDELAGNDTFLSASMPLKLARPDRPIILVDVLVDGRNTYLFILDTGASQTVVSPALSQQMGVTSPQGDIILGAAGPVASSVGMLKSLRIGDSLLENVLVLVSDIFSPLNQAVGATMHGILGYNVLRRFKITIDYPNEKLQFQKE